MSSSLINTQQQESQTAGWARLIPGEMPALRATKKLPQAVRPAGFRLEKLAELPREETPRFFETLLSLLMPRPLQSRAGWKWLRCTAADFVLVGLNWLLTGALFAPARTLFPPLLGSAITPGSPGSLLGIAFLNAALITLLGYSEGLYEENGNLRRQTRILGKSVLWATAVLCLANGLRGAAWATGALFFGVGGLNFAVLWAWRRSERRQRRVQLSGRDVRNALIVGAGAVGRRVAAYVEMHPDTHRAVCGFLDDEKPLGGGVIGRVGDLARLARTQFVDEVILAAPHDRRLALNVLSEARRLRLDVEIVPELFGCKPGNEEEHLGDLPLICLHAERLPAAGLALKRLLDIAGAGFALLVLLPLLALIAALVRLNTPGPALYRAPRAGRKGRSFLCYKFRTMVNNADELRNNLRQNNQRSGPFFKIADDPRVTLLGRFLRRHSLDELPQLWNVLRGEMSLVGPRPHPLDDLAGYETRHLARLDVTPGMTGLWQVTARRDPSFERGMELDMEYVRTWSLTSDLRILLKTVSIVLCGGGD